MDFGKVAISGYPMQGDGVERGSKSATELKITEVYRLGASKDQIN